MSKRHRHKTWLIAGGYIEWCYQCGAWRQMAKVDGFDNGFAPSSKWQKPSGLDGVNPALHRARLTDEQADKKVF